MSYADHGVSRKGRTNMEMKKNKLSESVAMVVYCRDTPLEQFKSSERKGCNQYVEIKVKLIEGQFKCKWCGKRTRYNLNDFKSMSAAVHSGPYLDREAARIAAERLNDANVASASPRPSNVHLTAEELWGQGL